MAETQRQDIFTDEQMQNLVLGYMYSRNLEAPGQPVSTVDIQAFIDACKESVIKSESIKLAADGKLYIDWDKDTGEFAFAISSHGEAEVERCNTEIATEP